MVSYYCYCYCYCYYCIHFILIYQNPKHRQVYRKQSNTYRNIHPLPSRRTVILYVIRGITNGDTRI